MPHDWNATATEPETTAAERLLLIAMPPGWRVLGRCRWGLAGPLGHPTGCHALAHPSFGVALIDVAPDATPNAEARLRRTLAAEGFTDTCSGYLPVWHGRVEGGALRQLDGLVRDAFADLPPLTLSPRRGWPEAVAAALARDPAWQVPGHEPPPPSPPLFELPPPPPRRRRLTVPVGIGLLLAFMLGVGTGVLLLGGQDATSVPPPEAALPNTQLATRATPEPPTAAGAAAPVAVAPEPPAEAAPEPRLATASEPPAEESAATLPQEPAPASAALPEPPDTTALAPDRPDAPAAPPGVEEAELPLPPAVPPRHAARPALRPLQIDRACRDAVFRFSQGATLSWSEQSYLRNGCATRR